MRTAGAHLDVLLGRLEGAQLGEGADALEDDRRLERHQHEEREEGVVPELVEAPEQHAKHLHSAYTHCCQPIHLESTVSGLKSGTLSALLPAIHLYPQSLHSRGPRSQHCCQQIRLEPTVTA